MKKLKLLTNPTQLSRAYLDSLNEIDDPAFNSRLDRYQARKWRSFREDYA